MEASDTGGVLEYLQERQAKDSNFFYAIQVDQDGLIANIFWADMRMKVDFAYFGDVVSFDTTYRKNKEGRPFALFVGVNHHKQTVVFGAALLYDETTDTFMWLFDTFSRAMLNKKPQTIFTDQDAAMAKALAIKWPETHHCLCIWHIYQNVASHLSHIYKNRPDFTKDLNSCIYDHDEEEDFLSAWQEMLKMYDLQENEWLQRLFNIKEKWAMVYGRQYFCGDIISTQRSEGMNSALKKYATYKHNMLQFFQNFERLVDDRRFQELKADFFNSQRTPKLAFRVEILKHAVSIYTHEVFRLFQSELSKGYDFVIELCNVIGDISEYKITPPRRHLHHMVTYHSSTSEVNCGCKKIQFAGILCSHALKVLSIKNIVRIPGIYIMKRWTKRANKGVFDGESHAPHEKYDVPRNEDGERKIIGVRLKELNRLNTLLVTCGQQTSESYEIAKSSMLKAIEEIDETLEKKTAPEPRSQPKSLPSKFVQKGYLGISQTKRTEEASENVGAVDEVTINGVKIREKKNVKSGKRLMGGLEIAFRKKNPKTNHPSSNDMSSVDRRGGNDNKNIDGDNLTVTVPTKFPLRQKPGNKNIIINGGKGTSLGALTQPFRFSPLSQQSSVSQDSQLSRTPFMGGTRVQEVVVVPSCVLFIQNLPHQTTHMMLQILFSQHVGFKEVRMIQVLPGIAYVEYENEMQSSIAMQKLQGFKINDVNPIVITYAKK